jgi:hypothetical protein
MEITIAACHGTRKQWMDYWDTTTGHRARMMADVK